MQLETFSLFCDLARTHSLAGTATGVQVRALGGLTGYSGWSMAVTRFVP
jgi:hypothetical protein